jgi:flagellar motor switch protein FliN
MSDSNSAESKANQSLEDDWAAAMQEQAQSQAAPTPPAAPKPKPKQPAPARAAGAGAGADAAVAGTAVAMPELEATADVASAGDRNLDMILEIPVTIAMEIGRTRVPIRNLLQLTQGSVVELDRLAGEPLDVTVNGTLIAHGEVVVVNERYGIRFTDVVSPTERVRKLR